MTIWEHVRDITPYRVYGNGCSADLLSNRCIGIAEVILKVGIWNFEKIDFWPRTYKNSLEDHWPFGNV